MSGIANIKLVGLDSNVFIYNLEHNPQFISSTDFIFNQLLSNKLKAATSIISLIEMLSYPGTADVEEKIVEEFFSTPNLEVFEVTKEIATKAARIRRNYKFRLPDSIQLATAIHAKAKAFISNDQRLKVFKEIPVILLSKI